MNKEISLESIKNELTKNQYEYLRIQLYNNCVEETTYYFGKDERGNVIYCTPHDSPRYGKRYFIHTIGKKSKFNVSFVLAETIQEKIDSCLVLIK